MGEALSVAEGAEPDEGQLLSQLIQLLSQRPQNSLMLSDLNALLPGPARKLLNDRGGLRSWLEKWPNLIRVAGEPGKESVTLTLGENSGLPLAPQPAEVAARPAEVLNLADSISAGAEDVNDNENRTLSASATPFEPASRANAANEFDEDTDGHCAVQLRGLPYRATVEDVKTFLGEFATSLVAENPVHLVLNRDGRPSGFARVLFTTPEAARLCRDGTHLRCMEDRYVEVFLYSERPSRGRRRAGTGEDADGLGGVIGDATGVTKEQVAKECRMAMGDPKNRHKLLSMLGVELSAGSRAYLKQMDQGLKHFLAQFPNEFSVEGGKGCEYVTYTPASITDGVVPNYTPIQLSEVLAPPAPPAPPPDLLASAAVPHQRAVGSSAAPPEEKDHLMASPNRKQTASTDPTPRSGLVPPTPSDRGMPSPSPPWGSYPWQPPGGGALPPWPAGGGPGAPTGADGASGVAAGWGIPPAWPMAPPQFPPDWLPPQFSGWDSFGGAAGGMADPAAAAAAAAFAAAAAVAPPQVSSQGAAPPPAGATDDQASGSWAIRLRGLPFTSNEQDVLAFFAQHDIVERIVDGPKAVTLLLRPNGRPTGQAQVQMRSRADAEIAQKVLDGKWMGSRYIEVFPHAEDGSVPGLSGNADASGAKAHLDGPLSAGLSGSTEAASVAGAPTPPSAVSSNFSQADSFPYAINGAPWAPPSWGGSPPAAGPAAPETSWEALFEFLGPEGIAQAAVAAAGGAGPLVPPQHVADLAAGPAADR